MKKRHSQKKPTTFSGIVAFLILFVLAAALLNYLIPVIIFLGVTAIIVGVVYILFKSPHYQEKEPTYGTDNRNSANPAKLQNESMKNSEFSIEINFDNTKSPCTQFKEQTGIDLDTEYAMLSTAGDENVCPMCAQFEGKIFLSSDAPKLPLCPSCSCAYMYYLKDDLPSNAIISNKSDFVLPAKCTSLFHKHQQELYGEKDINKQIQLCESDLGKLSEFIEPYNSANFPAPKELACRDLLPELYMQLGKWDKAEKTIKKCIEANVYSPDDGSTELKNLAAYKKVATETLSYIQQNPGCLQRNIYKKMGYDGEEKELLKDFLRSSKLIKKVKYNNTNQLFDATEELTNLKQ